MKKVILSLGLMLCVSQAGAEEISIQSMPYGSGTPGQVVNEPAVPVSLGEGIYHAPGYMPGYPTAGVIYPRIVDVKCTKVDGNLNCDGYNWLPEMGRGEYLLFRPHLVEAPVAQEDPAPLEPQVIYRDVPVKEIVIKEVEVPVIVYKEVPAKTGKE